MPSSSAKDNEIIKDGNVIVNTAEQDSAGRAKAEWMEGARLAGWSHKGDDALLNSLYDARTDGEGNVITEYDNILKNFLNPTDIRKRQKDLAAVRDFLKRGSSRKGFQPDKKALYDRINDEFSATQVLRQKKISSMDSAFSGEAPAFLGEDKKISEKILSEVTNPALAEEYAIGRMMFGMSADELDKLLREKGISPLVFAKTLQRRLKAQSEKIKGQPAVAGVDKEAADATYGEFKRYIFNYGLNEGELKEAEEADSLIDSFVENELKAFTKLDRESYEKNERERAEYLNSVEKAGWNEAYHGDREYFDMLFASRYDKGGKVIESIDGAIKDFALNSGKSRLERKEAFFNAVNSIPEELRTKAQKAFLENKYEDTEKAISDRDSFVADTMKHGWAVSKEDLKFLYDRMRVSYDLRKLLGNELRTGSNSRYRRRVSKDSPLKHVQAHELFSRIKERLEQDNYYAIGSTNTAEVIPVLNKIIEENETGIEADIAEERDAWFKNAREAGWNLPGDERLLERIYEAGKGADGRISENYWGYLKKFEKTAVPKDRGDCLYTVRRHLSGLNKSTEEQIKLKDELIFETNAAYYLNPNSGKKEAAFFLDNRGNIKPDITAGVKDPALAESIALIKLYYGTNYEKKAEIMRENGVSPIAFMTALKNRLYAKASRAVRGPGNDSGAVQNLRDLWKIFSGWRLPVQADNEEIKKADSFLDGFVKAELSSYKSIDRPFYEQYEKEKAAYLKKTRDAGWNEYCYYDTEYFDRLFDSRYDREGRVIPAVDKAISDLIFDKGDLRTREEKKKAYREAVNAVKKEDRTKIQETFVSSDDDAEKKIQEREAFIDRATKHSWGASREELRTIYDLTSRSGILGRLGSEFTDGVSSTYPRWDIDSSPVMHLERHELFSRLKKEAEGVEQYVNLPPGLKDNCIKVLDKLIKDNEVQAEKERVGLERHIDDSEKAMEESIKNLKENILSLKDNDLRIFHKSFVNTSLKRGSGLYNAMRKVSRLNIRSLIAIRDNYSGNEAYSVKKTILEFDRQAEEYLKGLKKEGDIDSRFRNVLNRLNPGRLKAWEEQIKREQEAAQKQPVQPPVQPEVPVEQHAEQPQVQPVQPEPPVQPVQPQVQNAEQHAEQPQVQPVQPEPPVQPVQPQVQNAEQHAEQPQVQPADDWAGMNFSWTDPYKRLDIQRLYMDKLSALDAIGLKSMAGNLAAAIEVYFENSCKSIPENPNGLQIKDFYGEHIQNLRDVAVSIENGTLKGAEAIQRLKECLEGVNDPSRVADNHFLQGVAAGIFQNLNLNDYALKKTRPEAGADFMKRNRGWLEKEGLLKYSINGNNGELQEIKLSSEKFPKKAEIDSMIASKAGRDELGRKIGTFLVDYFKDATTKKGLEDHGDKVMGLFDSPKYNAWLKLTGRKGDFHEDVRKLILDSIKGMANAETGMVDESKRASMEEKLKNVGSRIAEMDHFLYFAGRMDRIVQKENDLYFMNAPVAGNEPLEEDVDLSTMGGWIYGTGRDLEEKERKKRRVTSLPMSSRKRTASEVAEEIFRDYKSLNSIEKKIEFIADLSRAVAMPCTDIFKEAEQKIAEMVVRHECADAAGRPDRNKIIAFTKQIAIYLYDRSAEAGGASEQAYFYSRKPWIKDTFSTYCQTLGESIDEMGGSLDPELPSFSDMIHGYETLFANRDDDPLRKEKYDKTAKDVAMADFPEEDEIKLRGSRYTFSSDFGTIMDVEAAGRMAERYGRDLFLGPDKVHELQGLYDGMAEPGPRDVPEGQLNEVREHYRKAKAALKDYLDVVKELSECYGDGDLKLYGGCEIARGRCRNAADGYFNALRSIQPNVRGIRPDKQLFQSYMCLYACGSNSLRSKLDYDEEQPEWMALKKKVASGLMQLEADARKKAEKEEMENPAWQKEGVDYSIVRKSQLNNSKSIVLNYFKTMDNKWLNHSGTLKKLEAELISANGKKAAAVQMMGAILSERYKLGKKISEAVAGAVYDHIKRSGVPMDYGVHKDTTTFVLRALDFSPLDTWKDFNPGIRKYGDHYVMEQGYRPQVSTANINTFKTRLLENFDAGTPWKEGLEDLLYKPEKMDRLNDMFHSKKTINVNSDAYDEAKTAFEDYIGKRNALMEAVNDIRGFRADEAKVKVEEFRHNLETLGRKMTAYITYLSREQGGTELDSKTQDAGKARLAAAQITKREIEGYMGSLSQATALLMSQNSVSDEQHRKAIKFSKLYDRVLNDKKKKGTSDRHRSAAKKAARLYDKAAQQEGPEVAQAPQA